MLNNTHTHLKVVDFETSKKVGVKIKSAHEPSNIDPMYFEVAEFAIASLYQAFPFHKDFGERHWRLKSDDYFKSTVHLWGLEFYEKRMSSKNMVADAVRLIIERSISPSLGNFIAAYWKNETWLAPGAHMQYISFLEARLHYAYTYTKFNADQNKSAKQ